MSTTKASRSVVIANTQGLHLRPAGVFAELAKQFQSQIEVVRDFNRVDGSSPMMLVSLGAVQGATLTIEAEGQDAQEAINALADLIENFTDAAAEPPLVEESSSDEGALPPPD